MKVKKVAIGVFLALALVAVFSMNADAADAWYTCTIDRIGGQNNYSPMAIFAMLSDTKAAPTFTQKYFRLPAMNTNQVLAILLTAVSGGFQVMVYADESLPNSNDRVIKLIYLLNQ